MKQSQLVEAYKAIKKLSDIPMDLHIAYRVMKLKKQLEEHYEFERQEELKALQQYHGEFAEDGITTKFPTKENQIAFWNKIRELKNMDIDIDIVSIDLGCNQDIKLTPSDMEALDGFILFE